MRSLAQKARAPVESVEGSDEVVTVTRGSLMTPLYSLLKQELVGLNATHGLAEAARRAGLAQATVLKLLAGLPVREGTLLTAQHHLALCTVPVAGDLAP